MPTGVYKHRPHTIETRAKMSVAAMGRKFTPEHRAKISAAMMGRKLTPEHRAKISAAWMGKKNPRFSHGHAPSGHQSQTYTAWLNMFRRCQNPNYKNYKYWGGRGIRVCKRWRLFENFLTDMGKRPKNRSLDRIDNEGNYKLSNCRWATSLQQARNRRVYG